MRRYRTLQGIGRAGSSGELLFPRYFFPKQRACSQATMVVVLAFWGSFVVACVTFLWGKNDTSKLVLPLEI